ncbi:MAG: 4Fe-4S dicluster domain-containing protein [Alphaproteobacteria bacterium]|nr:4Fe-4S dicluster domain-containing protein [Alphaproteobacteria bacterium]
MAAVEAALGAAGFTPRGAFHPEPADGVPALAGGEAAATVVLAGNAGPTLWRAFTAASDPVRDLLNDWVEATVTQLAERFGAGVVFPHQGPPFLPFQRWAMRAEAVHPSPIGLLIHPDYGLWHAYRAALLFAVRLDLPERDSRPAPCDGCAEKPCLTTCPVGALAPARYDVPACIAHISSTAGADCAGEGCRARRACPVGRAWRYIPEQAEFHMRAFRAAHQP